MEFYDALCPYNQNDMIEIREAEPYSCCQFIMGRDHTGFGRARHPFMTGTGGWAYFAATRYILGIRPQFDSLVIDPCIPADWKEFQVNREWRGVRYDITVQNPDGVMKGVKSITLNGIEVDEIRFGQPEGSDSGTRGSKEFSKTQDSSIDFSKTQDSSMEFLTTQDSSKENSGKQESVINKIIVIMG